MMKNLNAPEIQSKRDILVLALAAVLGLASMFAQLQPAHADTITAAARTHGPSGASGE